MFKPHLILLFLCIFSCIGLSACGQAGKLYLPQPTDISPTSNASNHET